MLSDLNSNIESGEVRYKMLYVYAFFEWERDNPVHEDLCLNSTISEAIAHAREFWIDADDYKVSDKYNPYPFWFLFDKNRTAEKISLILVWNTPSIDEINKEIERLDLLNS
jgi:hypothetical protein